MSHLTGDARKRNEGGSLHSMRFTFDRGSVDAEAICYAPAGADCRLTPVSCECEEWGEIRRDDAGRIWHRIVDGSETEPQWHEVKPQDDCNVCLFINESGCVEELCGDTFTLAEFPIRPLWEGDGYDWEPLGEPVQVAAREQALIERIAQAIEAVAPDWDWDWHGGLMHAAEIVREFKEGD